LEPRDELDFGILKSLIALKMIYSLNTQRNKLHKKTLHYRLTYYYKQNILMGTKLISFAKSSGLIKHEKHGIEKHLKKRVYHQEYLI